MRAWTLGVIASGALVVACMIDRPSDSLTCSTTDECAGFDGNRVCMGGYCIEQNCPDDCTTCDEANRTCIVECNAPGECDDIITCPSGWSCTVNCNGGGTCNDITCSSNSRCAINCNGPDACSDIDCDSACQCDLTCASGACGSFACPSRGNGANQVQCTVDGTTATTCDSAHAASCAGC
jgi:hypothetical protein